MKRNHENNVELLDKTIEVRPRQSTGVIAIRILSALVIDIDEVIFFRTCDVAAGLAHCTSL